MQMMRVLSLVLHYGTCCIPIRTRRFDLASISASQSSHFGVMQSRFTEEGLQEGFLPYFSLSSKALIFENLPSLFSIPRDESVQQRTLSWDRTNLPQVSAKRFVLQSDFNGKFGCRKIHYNEQRTRSIIKTDSCCQYLD